MKKARTELGKRLEACLLRDDPPAWAQVEQADDLTDRVAELEAEVALYRDALRDMVIYKFSFDEMDRAGQGDRRAGIERMVDEQLRETADTNHAAPFPPAGFPPERGAP